MSIILNPEALELAIKAANAVIDTEVVGISASTSVEYAHALIIREKVKQAITAWVKYSQTHGKVVSE